MIPLIRSKPFEIEVRLASLRLSLGTFRTVAARAHLAFASCSPNDAPFYPGTVAWGIALRSLREELLPKGWNKADPGNYSLTIEEELGIAIVVASGDEATGLPHLPPRTRSSKGIHTAAAVDRNQRDLFIDEATHLAHVRASEVGLQTWILLLRVEETGARLELSCPARIDDQGRISEWAERIILPRYDGEDGSELSLPRDLGPTIDVPVVRRA